MSASIVFEVRESDPDSDLGRMLVDLAALPERDTARRRISAAIAIWWATRELEECAVSEATDRREKNLRERRAATRAKNAGTA